MRKGDRDTDTAAAVAAQHALDAFRSLGSLTPGSVLSDQEVLHENARRVGFKGYDHLTAAFAQLSVRPLREAANELLRRVCLLRVPDESDNWFDFEMDADGSGYSFQSAWVGDDGSRRGLRVAASVDGHRTCMAARDLMEEDIYVLQSSWEVSLWTGFWRGRALLTGQLARKQFPRAFEPARRYLG